MVCGSTGTVSHTINVGEDPSYIAVGPAGNIWVADYYGNIAVGSSGNVWVANWYSGIVAGTVSEINGATGAVSHTVILGKKPGAIAVDPSGNAWVANAGSGTVSEINGSTAPRAA